MTAARENYLKMMSQTSAEINPARAHRAENMWKGCATEQSPPKHHRVDNMWQRTHSEPNPKPHHRVEHMWQQSINPPVKPRHVDVKQFSQSINPFSPPRHYDLRGRMHTPLNDINAAVIHKNPEKIGTPEFSAEGRRRRSLPVTPQPKEMRHSVLQSDAANLGHAPAPPPKIDFAPGELADPDAHFISTLRVPSSLPVSRLSTPVTPDSASPSVFDRLSNPKQFTGIQKKRFSADGMGLGLLGSKDDTTLAQLIQNQGVILRDVDHQVESPHKTLLPEELERTTVITYVTVGSQYVLTRSPYRKANNASAVPLSAAPMRMTTR